MRLINENEPINGKAYLTYVCIRTRARKHIEFTVQRSITYFRYM